jgi:hypothetical protein
MIDYSGRLIKVEDITAPKAIAPLFLFGEQNRYPVEVTANDPTEVIELPKPSVLSLFRKNEQFLENYMNLSANYARTLSDKLFFMSFKTIRQKLPPTCSACTNSNNRHISPSTVRNRS